MKIKEILTLVYISISTITFSQTYNDLIQEAYAAYMSKDYKVSIDFFEKAFKKGEANSTEYFYAALANLQIENNEKFKTYLKKSVQKGFCNPEQLKQNNNEFKIHFKQREWKSMIKKSQKNLSKYEKDFQNIKTSLPGYYKVRKKVEGHIDLRTKFNKTPHQGRRNTCSAFASTGLMEFLVSEKENKKIDLSEAYTYYASKKFALTNDFLKRIYTSRDGCAGYIAVESFGFGTMLEKSWPYEAQNWLMSKDERCKKVDGKNIMECYTGVPPEDSETIDYRADAIFIDREDIGQYILQEKKPVAMNIYWYFESIDKEGNFHMPTQEELEGRKGGHVILLVGYNSRTRTFIFRNSWGTKFGNEGFGTIPEDYVIQYYEGRSPAFSLNTNLDEKIYYVKGSMGISAKLR